MKVSIFAAFLSTVSLAVGEANLYLQQPLVQPFGQPLHPLYHYYAQPSFGPPASPQGYMYLPRKRVGPEGPRIGSVPHFNDEDKAEEQDVMKKGSALTRQIGTCNELETEINNERARYGLGPLKCDHNMRWVANKHVENQLDNGYSDGSDLPNGCNGHSWFGAVGCCFSEDRATWPCMWNKPLELSKWDDRDGYEISAWSSAAIKPSGAMSTWRGSSGHHDVILTQGIWTDLQTVGCGWQKTVAHCWFAKTEP